MTDGPRRTSGLPGGPAADSAPRPLRARLLLAACALFAFFTLIALGTWQLQRLQWKRALIERVEQRVHAAPVPAPGPAYWPQVSAESDEYRHVFVRGTFLPEAATRTQAVTRLGAGYWLLAPLRAADGSVFLVNRGFIPAELAQRDFAPPSGAVTVSGLLRLSEPGGGFLRRNDPAAGRWYSRDVQAIAAAHGLQQVAPFFIDADAAPQAVAGDPAAYPVGGLTVISFPNNHLVYALTWYALALMVAGAAWWVVRMERRLPRRNQGRQ